MPFAPSSEPWMRVSILARFYMWMLEALLQLLPGRCTDRAEPCELHGPFEPSAESCLV